MAHKYAYTKQFSSKDAQDIENGDILIYGGPVRVKNYKRPKPGRIEFDLVSLKDGKIEHISCDAEKSFEVKEFSNKQFSKPSYVIIDNNEKVLDIDGNFVDFRTTAPDEYEWFDDKKDAEERAKEVNGTVKEFSKTFILPEMVNYK